MPWLMRRVREQKAIYYNPFSYKGYEISLKPEDVDVMVFLSKNYAPLLPYLDELQSLYRLYFHFTITGLSGVLEERVPPVEEMVNVLQELSRRTSPAQVEWRFDPIVLTNVTPPEFYRKEFATMAARLEGFTTRCYVSFATIYDKVKRSFQEIEQKKGIQLLPTDMVLYRQMVNELATVGREHGIQLYSCCNDFLQSELVQKGRCIDGDHLSALFDLQKVFPKSPTREGCGCARCVDLGVYDTCPHGCSYCYANVNKKVALTNYHAHTPEDEILLPGRIEVVKRLPTEGDQIALF
jgi:DNA repair photolyase